MKGDTGDMRGILAAGAAVALVLTAGFILCPLTSAPGTFTDLDGSPAYIDHDWSDDGVQGIFYMTGDVLCHQECDRCPQLNGNQMPVCHRDLGIILGMGLGLLLCIPLWNGLGDRRTPFIAIALGCVTVVQWMFNDPSGGDGALRFVTGLVSGIGAGLFMGWMLKRNVVNDG